MGYFIYGREKKPADFSTGFYIYVFKNLFDNKFFIRCISCF